MNAVIEEISKIGIVPVIAIDDAKDALPLAKALIDGGLPCAEVTFRTAAAEESIRLISEAYPEMLVGAGTVLTTDQADRAIAAGAKFLVSPGLNPKIVRHSLEKGVPMLPGCANPSDVEAAIELGLEVVKFFPAEAAGGIKMIKAMAAPYTSVKFMPTGGISAANLLDYLSFSKIVACGGSWMVSKDLINSGNFEKITALTREAVSVMLGFEVAHIGLNAANEDEASAGASDFAALFGFASKVGNSSIFAGSGIEIMKTPYLGAHGHIAVATTSVERAMYHLGRQGVTFREDAIKRDASGKIVAAYLEKEICGFAIHLVAKK